MKEFNTNMLINITFNCFYFKNESKKAAKINETQNKKLQGYIKNESVLEKEEKKI